MVTSLLLLLLTLIVTSGSSNSYNGVSNGTSTTTTTAATPSGATATVEVSKGTSKSPPILPSGHHPLVVTKSNSVHLEGLKEKKKSSVITDETTTTTNIPVPVATSTTNVNLKHRGNGNSQLTTTKVDQLLSSTAATNGLFGKEKNKIKVPNAIRQKQKDQHISDPSFRPEKVKLQKKQMNYQPQRKDERSLKLTKRSSSDESSIDQSSLAESLFNFLLQPNANR